MELKATKKPFDCLKHVTRVLEYLCISYDYNVDVDKPRSNSDVTIILSGSDCALIVTSDYKERNSGKFEHSKIE
jgi:hypothetical protein